jgi:release factor glutamine methyltransferase
MILLRPALAEAAKKISAVVQTTDQAWAEAELLLAHALNRERTWVLAHPEAPLPARAAKKFAGLVARRQTHEPMAYLLGYADFFGRRFKTDARALIPRPETEELVERALHAIRTHPAHSLVIDVGTGSGAMAISIKASAPSAAVIATELEARTLTLAKQNARHLLKKNAAIRFVKANLLASSVQKAVLAAARAMHPKQLILVANLPYLPKADKKRLSADVVKFEPAKALFAENEGNAEILKCLSQLNALQKTLHLPVAAFFEFDPPQAKTLATAAAKIFPHGSIRVEKDLCGRDRILEIRLSV